MGTEGRGKPLPQPIEVQGLTVRPGDQVLLQLDGESILRTYEGIDAQTGGVFLVIEDMMTSDPRQDAGPWALELLRHPDILGGFIREVDASS